MIYNLSSNQTRKNFLKEHNDTIFDIIIIGAGPATYVLYDKLKKKKNILIIERGSENHKNSLNQNKVESVISNENYKIKKDSRYFGIGGTGNIWGGVSSYIEEFEMNERWSKNINLWPISHKEILSFSRKIDNKYGFDIFNQISTNYNNKISNYFRKRNFIANLKPFKFNNSEHYNKCNILLNAKVDYIDQKNNLAKVFIGKFNLQLSSKKIIICCGGLETNFLILKSLKIGKLIKAKNKKIVGKYFMDHPKFDLGVAEFGHKGKKFIEDVGLKKNKKDILYTGLSLNKKIQIKKKLLNSYVRFEKYTFNDLKNQILIEKKNKNKIMKYLNITKIYLKIFKFYLYKLFNKDFLLEKYKIILFNEMVPRKENKIIYIKNNSLEKFKIKYQFSNTEFKTIYLLKRFLENIDGITINYKNNMSKKNIIKNLKDSSHHMGGTLMGSNQNNSFVNKNLEIHGIKNIFICSTSVFPTSGSVNPTMTLCALAARLSKYINKTN
mgnify:CR=1 FL=1